MRALYISASGLSCLIVVLFWGLALCLSLGVLLLSLYFLVDRKLTLAEYGRQIDNVYVSSHHEQDRYVEQRARDIEKLLEESGNKTGVKVLRFFYADAHCPDESWEEFIERVAQATKADREARHKWLNENRDKYLKHVLNQKLKS